MRRKILAWLISIVSVVSCISFSEANTIVAKAADTIYVERIEGCSNQYHLRVIEVTEDTVYCTTYLGTPGYLVKFSGMFKEVADIERKEFSWDVKVGDVCHLNHEKCTSGELKKVVHNCKETLSKVEEKTPSCMEDGYDEYYQCWVADCRRCWKDENATDQIINLDEWKIKALGHMADFNLNGNRLTMSECGREGCGSKGGSIELKINSDDYFAAKIIGSVSFGKSTGIYPNAEGIKYYKLIDGQYVKIDGEPSGYGTYYAELDVAGYTLKNDFVLRKAGSKHLVSETIEYKGERVGTFSSEHFNLLTFTDRDEGFDLNILTPNGWCTAAIDYNTVAEKRFEIQSKNGLIIDRVELYESTQSYDITSEKPEDQMRLSSHQYINTYGNIRLEQDYNIMTVYGVNDTHLQLRPKEYGIAFSGNKHDSTYVTKVVIYYTEGE